MLEALKVFCEFSRKAVKIEPGFRIGTASACAAGISSVTNMNSSPYLAKSCTIRSAS